MPVERSRCWAELGLSTKLNLASRFSNGLDRRPSGGPDHAVRREAMSGLPSSRGGLGSRAEDAVCFEADGGLPSRHIRAARGAKDNGSQRARASRGGRDRRCSVQSCAVEVDLTQDRCRKDAERIFMTSSLGVPYCSQS